MENSEKIQQAENLFSKAQDYLWSREHKKSIELYKKLLDEYSELCNVIGLHFWIGIAFHNDHQIEEAIFYFKYALERLDKTEESLDVMEILYRLSDIYYEIKEYDTALGYANEAEQYYFTFEESNMYEKLVDYRVIKGNIHFFLVQHKEAINEYEKAELYLDKINENKSKYASLLNYLKGRLYYYSKENQKANDYFKNVSIEVLEKIYHPSFYMNYMKVLINLKEYKEGIEIFSKLITLNIENSFISEVYHYAGIGFYHLNDYHNAKKYFNLSLSTPTEDDWLYERNIKYLDALKEIN